MTSDDPDTWRVVYSQFVGADSKPGIIFALNNDPEAQDGCKVSNITAEISHGNGPLQACLDRGNGIWVVDIHEHQLYCLQRKSTLQKAMKLAQIRWIEKSADFVRT